jgi:hypothetical protein
MCVLLVYLLMAALWRFSWYRSKHHFFKHIYFLHLAQYVYDLIKDSVPVLHTTQGFPSFICTRKQTLIPRTDRQIVEVPRPSHFLRRASHNSVLNCRYVIGFLECAKEVLHAATYIMNMFTTVMSNKKKNMRCHHLYNRFWVLYDPHNWSATSTPRI